MQIEEFAQVVKDGLLLRVYVQPGASRSQLGGLRRETVGGKEIVRLKIALRARALEGAANQALIEFVAELCRCPKSSISLTSGHSSRSKTLLIAGGGKDLKEKLESEAGAER